MGRNEHVYGLGVAGDGGAWEPRPAMPLRRLAIGVAGSVSWSDRTGE
ncbi:hypothetical protein IAE29_23400 [Ochrobactrum sp. S46]|nr:hypothetical protein [Ochrobactrum sp. S45]MBK0046268.1 hypothetical protein [Ochrobactrum sp. S46]